MNYQASEDNKMIHCLSGLFTGLILISIIYILVFQITNTPFSFQNLFGLHKSSYIFYIIDIIPFASTFIGCYTNRLFSGLQLKYKLKLQDEQKSRDEVRELASDLIKGEFSKVPAKNKENDELISILENLRTSLIKNRESEQLRIKEDNKRNWISEGLAMFGEILRMPEEDMETLAYKLISNLVKYLKANQGGFYLIEERETKEKYFQMLACFAYDRKKYADKIIEWGDGLIGNCALEKKLTYMTDIPDGYLTITSGLGKANPDNLIIVPLLANDEVHGIIELASFNKIENFQIDFIERLAESIAMTLSGIKGNLKTKQLLHETQKQALELASQEEKVRQNIEELKATQELAAVQADRFISFTNSVNHTLIRAEYDKDGYLLYANTKFLKKLGYSGNKEVEGKHISLFINEKDRSWFNEIWENLSKGGIHFEGYMKHVTKKGQDLWTMATYTCIRLDSGSVDKILFLGIDTTDQKKQSLDFEGQISALNRLSLKTEYAPDGKLLSVNEIFINTLKYTEKELLQKSIFDFLDPKDIENFNDIWEHVIRGNPYQGQIRLLSKYDEEKWFRASFASVNDMYNEVAKVIFIANEITNEKLMEAETSKQTERLKQQEEKLRITSMEMSRKIEEKNAEWVKLLAAKENEKLIYSNLLYEQEDISFMVNNLGVLIFLSKSAEKYWNMKSKNVLGKSANEVFGNDLNMPETLQKIMDPSKEKTLDPVLLKVPDSKNNLNLFEVKFLTSEVSGNIYYTSILSPAN